MNEALKIGLFAVGGYFLYEYLFAPATAVAAPASSVAAGTSIAPSGVVTTSSGATPATNVTGQVAKFAASGALMTSSQWNYYQNLDNPGGNIILGGPSIPSGNISYAQWQAAFNSLGAVIGPQPAAGLVSTSAQPVGVNAMAGLGHIINLDDLTTPSELGWGVGDDEFEYGLGVLLGAKPGAMKYGVRHETDARWVARGFSGLSSIVNAPENNAAYIDENVFIEAAATDGGLDASSQDFYLAAGLPIK